MKHPLRLLLALCLLWASSALAQRIPGLVDPFSLNSVNQPGDELCLTYEQTSRQFQWQTCAAGGSGDQVSVNAASTTDPSFNDGDIDWTLSGPDTTITATVACADCVALTTETSGNYVASHATGLGLTGGAAGSEGATLTTSIDYAQTLAGNPALNVEECVFSVDGTGGGGFLCEGNVGGNSNEQLHIFAAADGADTTDFIATRSAAVTDAVGGATTDTFTNKTLDVEGTGNSITTVTKVWLPVASCQNATASLLWDVETSNPPVAACITGTNTQKGVADFDPTTDQCLQTHLQAPADWTGAIDARYVWLAAATSGATGWCTQIISTADAETDDPAFPAQGASNCVSDTAKGTTLQVNQADDTGLTITGVAAGELLHLRLCRDANGSAVTDDMTGNARLIGVEYTLRRAQ